MPAQTRSKTLLPLLDSCDCYVRNYERLIERVDITVEQKQKAETNVRRDVARYLKLINAYPASIRAPYQGSINYFTTNPTGWL